MFGSGRGVVRRIWLSILVLRRLSCQSNSCQKYSCESDNKIPLREVMKLLASNGIRVKAFLAYSWQTAAAV